MLFEDLAKFFQIQDQRDSGNNLVLHFYTISLLINNDMRACNIVLIILSSIGVMDFAKLIAFIIYLLIFN